MAKKKPKKISITPKKDRYIERLKEDSKNTKSQLKESKDREITLQNDNTRLSDNNTTLSSQASTLRTSNDSLSNQVNTLQNDKLYIRRTSMTDMAYKFLTVKQENDLLDNQIKNTTNKYSTDNKKVEIRTADITKIKAYRVVAFVLYYICVALFSFMLITSSSLGTAVKVILILLAVAYPFYMNILAQAVTYIYRYIYAITMSIKYKPT